MVCAPRRHRYDSEGEVGIRQHSLLINPNEKVEGDELDQVKKWVVTTLLRPVKTVEYYFKREYRMRTQPDKASTHWNRNIDKNRQYFREVLSCWDDTRVKINFSEEFGLSSDYINANYVGSYHDRKRFICTQGPLENTRLDFWRMVTQEKSTIIVMLCQVSEFVPGGPFGIPSRRQRCSQYWPEVVNETYCFGEGDRKITIKALARNEEYNYENVIMTKLYVKWTDQNGNKFGRTVYHYQYKRWYEMEIPNLSDEGFTDFCDEIRGFSCRPIVVHSSLGVGRSGTFVAILHAQECLHNGKTYNRIDELLSKIRAERGHAIYSNYECIFTLHALLRYVLVDKKSIFGNLIDYPDIRNRYNDWLHQYDKVSTGIRDRIITGRRYRYRGKLIPPPEDPAPGDVLELIELMQQPAPEQPAQLPPPEQPAQQRELSEEAIYAPNGYGHESYEAGVSAQAYVGFGPHNFVQFPQNGERSEPAQSGEGPETAQNDELPLLE